MQGDFSEEGKKKSQNENVGLKTLSLARLTCWTQFRTAMPIIFLYYNLCRMAIAGNSLQTH
jgi:hypothetical protein